MKLSPYIILIALFAGLGSCNKFLDVKPEDSVLEETLYTSEEGFQIHLNGIYLGLRDSTLYGGQLTMEMMEVLAQRYNCSAINHILQSLAGYDYTKASVKSKFNLAWKSLYREIANVNEMLEKADEHKELFTGNNYELLKGEGLGLRAFLHFDALRMFGPVYKIDSLAPSIPYYTFKSTAPNPLLAAKEVIEKVLADLNEAETYLQKDAIITAGTPGTGAGFFTTDRHLRMNYYAVKLLQARVYLYANRKVEALAAAKAVIDKQPAWFPFVIPANITSSINPDRTFSTELVFAAQDMNIYTRYKNYFTPTQAETNILAPVQTRLDKVYESSTNDLRYLTQFWAVPSDGAKSYKCFYKYAPVTKVLMRNLSVPLMRVTEAYLIAAEASTVTADKFQYLNAVRNARQLTSLAVTAAFATELTKEYQKEFFGEGQLFFYYKRLGTASIDNGSAASGTITMINNYVLPLPDSETDSRN
jgi:hypothetical protein